MGSHLSLIPEEGIAQARMQEAVGLPSLTLTTRQLCDLELLLNGAFAPLKGFMQQADYQSVLAEMRLSDGTLYPMPITLDVDQTLVDSLKDATKLVLRDQEGKPRALLEIGEIWQADKRAEARAVFGTDDPRHPGIIQLLDSAPYYLGGNLEGIALPEHFDFSDMRLTPDQTRALLADGTVPITAVQTRNPLHRGHETQIAQLLDAGHRVLLQPVVGLTQPGDLTYAVRVHTYRNLLRRFKGRPLHLCLIPLAMRLAGPREALWHALIRRNHGATGMLIWHDHAGPGDLNERRRYYQANAAFDLVRTHAAELEMDIVEGPAMAYDPSTQSYAPASGTDPHPVSSNDLRHRLVRGQEIPGWLMLDEDVSILRRAFPTRDKQGITLFFTGLSGAGKSTIARAVFGALQELGRPITLLDGDVVRLNLSKGLGFSREDRDTNILRIGYVASLITKCGGIAVCAPIAPYRETRRKVREMAEAHGGFVEIHVATSLEVCEARDPKGLYAKARAGEIKQMTGIDDPYEVPENPELRLDTAALSVRASMNKVLEHLQEEGYIPGDDPV